MEDIEIYDLATDVISSIAADLNENLYSKINGRVNIVKTNL